MDREAEAARGTFTTNGFWMGKYETTQREWGAVMRGTPLAAPSNFRVGGSESGKLGGITDTGRFPVENVSWDDCQQFLARANAHGGVRKAFGRPGALVLPHENEWEYACRGGLGTARPFYFGDKLTGAEASCDASKPYGTTVAGAGRLRPMPVGSFETKFPHPWGLCDMHGNVWEWSENTYGPAGDKAPPQGDKAPGARGGNAEEYESPGARVGRGGSWYNFPANCRSAKRRAFEPTKRFNDCGFRVCFHPN